MEGHSLDDNLFPELDPTHCFNGHNLSPPHNNHHQHNHHQQHHQQQQSLISIDSNNVQAQQLQNHPQDSSTSNFNYIINPFHTLS